MTFRGLLILRKKNSCSFVNPIKDEEMLTKMMLVFETVENYFKSLSILMQARFYIAKYDNMKLKNVFIVLTTFCDY